MSAAVHFHCDDGCTIKRVGRERCVRHGGILSACHGGCEDDDY